MKMIQWLKWFCIGLLALVCAVGLTACSDDDDDDGDAVDTAGAGETIIIQEDDGDAPATPVVDDAADGDADADGEAATLTAPQLVAPVNGAVRNISTDAEYIQFEWTAVTGARSYILEVNGNRRTVGGTSATISLGAGVYRWRVSARDAAGVAGPASGFFTYRIISVPMPI